MKTEAIKRAPTKWFLTMREMKEGDHHAEITLSKDSGFAEDSDEYMRVSGICSVANAKLIASAPELLEELKKAHNFITVFLQKMPDHLIPSDWTDAMHGGLKSMDSAIKKATE